jgi:hypothetical protein
LRVGQPSDDENKPWKNAKFYADIGGETKVKIAGWEVGADSFDSDSDDRTRTLRLYGATSTQMWDGEYLGITAGEVTSVNTNITSTFSFSKTFTADTTVQKESCETEINNKLSGYTDVYLNNVQINSIKKYTETREELDGDTYYQEHTIPGVTVESGNGVPNYTINEGKRYFYAEGSTPIIDRSPMFFLETNYYELVNWLDENDADYLYVKIWSDKNK